VRVDQAEAKVISVTGDVDFTERASFRESLQEAVAPETAIVDFSATSFMDSSAISQLLWCNRERVRAHRAPLRLVVGAKVARLFEVAGLGEIFPVYDTLEDAKRG
jgi:anti-anti-sigma factor